MLATATLLVAGCSANPAPASRTPRPSGTATASSGADGGVRRPATAYPIGKKTPFAPYGAAANAVINGPAVDEKTLKERHDAVEKDIAACMSKAGFEYDPTPFDSSPPVTLPWTRDAIPLPVLPSTRSDVVHQGYGQDDVEAEKAAQATDDAEDPNSGRFAAMSPKEQEAYQRALGGQVGEDDPQADTEHSCGGVAEAAHPSPGGAQESAADQYAPLIRAMGKVVDGSLAADPRVVALDAKWTDCMGQKGYDVDPPTQFRRAASLAPMNAYTLAVVTPTHGAVEWPDPSTPADQIASDRQHLVGSVAEHEIAVADFDCRAETDYAPTVIEVLMELERNFVAAHKADLTSLLAASAD